MYLTIFSPIVPKSILTYNIVLPENSNFVYLFHILGYSTCQSDHQLSLIRMVVLNEKNIASREKKKWHVRTYRLYRKYFKLGISSSVLVNPLTAIFQKNILPLHDRNHAYVSIFQCIHSNVFLIS